MQNASPQKPLILVTIGAPGSGKSFFARRFSETFNAPLVSFDEIRAELFNDPTYSDDENFVIARIAALQLRELLKNQKTIIIDGGHNPKVNRTELEKVIKKAGYSTLYVWVQSDEKTARSRSLKRRETVDDDQFNRSLTNDEFESQAKKFTAPGRHETFVVISGRHTYPTQAKAVLKKMIAPNETRPAATQIAKPSDHGRHPISL